MTEQESAGAPKANPSPGGQEPRPVRVLLAEDEQQVRNVALRALKLAGFEVTAAVNGQEALTMLRDSGGAVDVVLSDILMPEMDGIEFAVRARAEYLRVRFVFMTGFSDISRDRERARGLCEAILGKPFDLDELIGTLHEAAAAE